MNSKSTWLLLAAVVLAAAPSLATAQLKIGYADIPRLRAQAPQMQAASVALEREFATRQRELIAEQQALEQLQERLTREAEVITDQEQAMRLQRELRTRQRDLQRSGELYEEDLNMRRNEEIGKLQRLIFSEIQAFAKAEGYDMVLVEGVVHAGPAVDITDRVLQRLQARANGQP